MKKISRLILLCASPFALYNCAAMGDMMAGKEVAFTLKDGQPSMSITLPTAK